MKNLLLILHVILICSCNIQDAFQPVEHTYEPQTAIYNNERVSEITAEFDKDKNEFYVQCVFLPGKYSLSDNLFTDGKKEKEETPSPVFTLNAPFAFQYSYLYRSFNDSITMKVYNYEYDPADSTIVTNKELLAEATIIRK